MSDFASLLGKLQDTADRARSSTAASASTSTSTTSTIHPPPPSNDNERHPKRRRQRQGKNNDDIQPPFAKHGTIRPRDIHQLTIRPSFFCIGAQKAGTTWLHEMLRRHDGISLPVQKEVHFFDWHRKRGLGWYSRQFPTKKCHRCHDNDDDDPKMRTHKSPIVQYGEITPCYAILDADKVRFSYRCTHTYIHRFVQHGMCCCCCCF